MAALTFLIVSIFVINLPFGYWREGVRRLSAAWFVAVHAPVPLVVGLRLWLGVDWSWSTVPLLVAAYFAGQAAGAWLRRRRARA